MSLGRTLVVLLVVVPAVVLASSGSADEIRVRGIPVSPNAPVIDPPAPPTVRDEMTDGSNPLGCSAAEWKARTELSVALNFLYLHGKERSTTGSDQAAQCMMLRHPEHSDQFLMQSWSVWFEETRASNLRRYDFLGNEILSNGTVVHALASTSNLGCIPVASAIFTSRPDANSIVHIHPYAVVAVGGTKDGLLPLSQAAFFLYGQVSRQDYEFAYDKSFEETLAAGFAHGERAMLLNHHGMYAIGRNVGEAIFVATHLTQACEVQVNTLSMVGGDFSKIIVPSAKDLADQYVVMMDSPDYTYDGSREWPGIVRKVVRERPDFNL